MKVIFDVSDLRRYLQHSQNVTGIQRVVVQALAEVTYAFSDREIWLGYYDDHSHDYLCVPFIFDEKIDVIHSLKASLGMVKKRNVISILYKYNRNPLKRLYHTYKLDYHASRNDEKYFRRLNTSSDEWKELRNAKNDKKYKFHIENIESVVDEGDVLYILDNIINSSELFWAIPSEVYQKLVTITFVHDLIPLVMPTVCHPGSPEKFYNALLAAAKNTNIFLANSMNTREDLDRFLSVHGIKTPITTVPLAQNFSHLENYTLYPNKFMEEFPKFIETQNIGERVLRICNSEYVLCVGTREIRKNLLGLAKAWRGLVDDFQVETKLVIAGRSGWLNEEFEILMEQTSYLDGHIEIIDGANDNEITCLYKHCLFTVCVSKYEGWGLPVGEGLAHGKTAVVSKISSLPEVGGECVEYCEPSDVESIKNACMTLLGSHEDRCRLEKLIAERPVRTWRDFVFGLKSAIPEIDVKQFIP